MDAKKGAKKRGDHPSKLSRWQKDEKYRTSQLAIRWTETYVKYLDYLTTVDISQKAPHRKEIVMKTWSSWEVTIQISQQDHCGKEKITKQQVRWCAFNKNKAKVYLIFRYRWGQDSTTRWILPFNKIWNGSARTVKRTSRHWLHPLLRHGHKTRHGGILNSGESGKLKNGKTKSGGRNGKRRQQTIRVHLVPETGACVVSVVARVALVHWHCSYLFSFFSLSTDRHRSVVQYTVGRFSVHSHLDRSRPWLRSSH